MGRISGEQLQKALISKFGGPFEIVKKYGNVAYRLVLPDRLKVHPSFHASYLKLYHGDLVDKSWMKSRHALQKVQKMFTGMVEKTLNHKTRGIVRRIKEQII